LAERGIPAEPTADPSSAANDADSVDAQPVLLEVRPSWWNFGWHLVFCWLIVPLLIALYRRHCFRMRIYADRVSVEQGFWTKESSEFFIKDIRSVDVRQGVWGRLVGIGDVTISTAASVDAAEEAFGVPDPNRIKELLISRRQRSPV
jgi:membrane protein YdbS with pleckstrin-like domain